MSTASAPAPISAIGVADTVSDTAHHVRVAVGYLIAIALIVGLLAYGSDYYLAGPHDRPFMAKHTLLRPSGRIGVKLGILGFGMFLVIFLYPLRKRWAWLGQQGLTRHWLDYHVLLGIAAPFIIALHAAFKFRGFAGIAFWIMLAVSLSGVIGRYLYGQIPRRVNAAEYSRKELQDLQEKMASQLSSQNLLRESDVRSALRLPSQEMVDSLPTPVALIYMFLLDLARPLRIARLRSGALSGAQLITTLCGLLPTRHRELERAISIAREEAALSKRILFLSRSQQVFHLWHVVHKPFSYSFAILALIHIGVVLAMGFF
jgi:ABC-type multidrug transport system fused ATPase/permease subunit